MTVEWKKQYQNDKSCCWTVKKFARLLHNVRAAKGAEVQSSTITIQKRYYEYSTGKQTEASIMKLIISTG